MSPFRARRKLWPGPKTSDTEPSLPRLCTLGAYSLGSRDLDRKGQRRKAGSKQPDARAKHVVRDSVWRAYNSLAFEVPLAVHSPLMVRRTLRRPSPALIAVQVPKCLPSSPFARLHLPVCRQRAEGGTETLPRTASEASPPKRAAAAPKGVRTCCSTATGCMMPESCCLSNRSGRLTLPPLSRISLPLARRAFLYAAASMLRSCPCLAPSALTLALVELGRGGGRDLLCFRRLFFALTQAADIAVLDTLTFRVNLTCQCPRMASDWSRNRPVVPCLGSLPSLPPCFPVR